MSFSQSSRGSTPSSSPISIASRSSSLSIASSNLRPTPSACQPFSSSMRRPSSERPSAYVSDDDLLGADDAPCMRSAPSPPRPAAAWLARPLLPPVTKSSRSSSFKPVKP
ncbi:hypothetical protein WHR41_08161 [Cladosporium halotolerans]|uniref:Uncharacterized protein n=1 Tax=Cladosporium halotolerans TaxID=1052096 RepID=A0AB34KGF5_9PEZI